MCICLSCFNYIITLHTCLRCFPTAQKTNKLNISPVISLFTWDLIINGGNTQSILGWATHKTGGTIKHNTDTQMGVAHCLNKHTQGQKTESHKYPEAAGRMRSDYAHLLYRRRWTYAFCGLYCITMLNVYIKIIVESKIRVLHSTGVSYNIFSMYRKYSTVRFEKTRRFRKMFAERLNRRKPLALIDTDWPFQAKRKPGGERKICGGGKTRVVGNWGSQKRSVVVFFL